jgi:rhodanese-related sulfurtransferase
MLNQISFFQLDNLIRNRVPFTLLNLGPSLLDLYTSIFKMHLEISETLTNEISVFQVLEEKKVPKDAALVLICEDGKTSAKLLSQLEKKSYTNVYVINGGYQQLMTERSEA